MFRNEVGVFIRPVERHRRAVFCHPGRDAVFRFAKHVINLICCRGQTVRLHIVAGLDNDACFGCIELPGKEEEFTQMEILFICSAEEEKNCLTV